MIDFGFGSSLTNIVRKDIDTTLAEFQKRQERLQARGLWNLSTSIETAFDLFVNETPSCAIALQNEDYQELVRIALARAAARRGVLEKSDFEKIIEE